MTFEPTWADSQLPPVSATLKALLSGLGNVLALDMRPELLTALNEQLGARVYHKKVTSDDISGLVCGRLSENTLLLGAETAEVVLICGSGFDSSDALRFAELARSAVSHGRRVFLVLDVGMLSPEGANSRISCFREVLRRCGVYTSTTHFSSLAEELYYAVIGVELANEPTRWMLGSLTGTDFREFRELFAAAFGQDYVQGLWTWKYGNKRGRAVLARNGGRLVAFYGSTERRIRFFGHAGVALQICDVMVAPKERGILTKKGIMFQTAAAYLEGYLCAQSNTIAYGFPTKRHMRLGEKLGLYAEVARMAELRWTGLRCTADRWSVRLGRLRPGESLNWVIDAWERMAHSLTGSICVERDLEYLLYRYLEHPTRDYLLYRVSTSVTRRLIGGIVLQAHDDGVELVDVIGPRHQFKRLVGAAQSVAAASPTRTLYCWVTDGFVKEFADDNCTVTDLGLSVPTNVWVNGPDPQLMRDKWFLMSGDTEFR